MSTAFDPGDDDSLLPGAILFWATYGLHRLLLWLVYDYYKYRRNIPGPTPASQPAGPRVTVQLPIFQ